MGKRISLVVALAVLCASFVAPTAAPAQQVGLSSLESGVLAQLNEVREQHGLLPVKLSARLTAAAGEHSKQMAADGYFDHTSPDGAAFWKRISHWYAMSGYHYWSVGENLLWSSPEVDPAGALKLWMKSPEHRANILTPRWREIGVSALHVASAPGVFHGLEVTIITTDFGVRR